MKNDVYQCQLCNQYKTVPATVEVFPCKGGGDHDWKLERDNGAMERVIADASHDFYIDILEKTGRTMLPINFDRAKPLSEVHEDEAMRRVLDRLGEASARAEEGPRHGV
jgi:hypothetical protein